MSPVTGHGKGRWQMGVGRGFSELRRPRDRCWQRFLFFISSVCFCGKRILNRSQRRERRGTWAGKTPYPLCCRSLFPSFASVEKKLNRSQRRERRETWAGKTLYPLSCRSLFPPFASVGKNLNRSQRRERRYFHPLFYLLSCVEIPPCMPYSLKQIN